MEVDGTDPGVPFALSVAVAVSQPVLAPLMQSNPRQLGHLGVHELLGKQAHSVAEKAGVSALIILVEQVQSVILTLTIVKAALDLHHVSRHNSPFVPCCPPLGSSA